jgi:hypothetical protein
MAGRLSLPSAGRFQGGARATETASPDSGQALSRENIQQLGLAALALLGRDGAPTQYVDEDNNPRGVRPARLGPSPGPGVVFLELKADERAFRGVDTYFVKRERKFRLDPKLKLFSLRETHFASPPDFDLVLTRDPALWFNPLMAALSFTLGLA